MNKDELLKKMEEDKMKQGKIERYFRSKGAFGYNLWYLMWHPWVFIREVWEEIAMAWQRAIRGWDKRQSWSIDVYYAKILGELLTYFKKVNNAVPISILEQTTHDTYPFCDQTSEEFEEACELWDEVLEEMAEGFLYYSNYKYDYDNLNEEMLNKKLNRSLELFSKHFRDLWW